MPERHPMTEWYDPRLLFATGLRLLLSTVFGRFYDRRETLAAANPMPGGVCDGEMDYRTHHPEGAPFWFDYVADSADGWEPTHAVARLLAAPGLELGGESLPRGRFLLMGGDQVYPDATPELYRDRLVAPYDAAFAPDGMPLWEDAARPDLYAVPGNHDWYDGLRAFLHLFCRRRVPAPGEAAAPREGRVIGGRRTRQIRSYFALRLPQGWWLWGVDSQFEGYVDQPQIDFFRHVAAEWMEPGSNLILCVPEPDWQYVDPARPEETLATLTYLSRLAGSLDRGHRLRLVLAGDSHHYSRYEEAGIQYVTFGGGGAFLHPTHHLENKAFRLSGPPPNVEETPGQTSYERRFTLGRKAGSGEEAVYPDRATSRRLSYRNLFFAWTNRRFLLLLMPFVLLFLWSLDAAARLGQAATGLQAALADAGGLGAAIGRFWQIATLSPGSALLAALAAASLAGFAEGRGWRRGALALGHVLAQGLVVAVVASLVLRGLGGMPALVALPLAAVAAGLAAATVFGLYLSLALGLLHCHWNDAFSALRSPLYKGFLRIRIGGDGALTLYPVGLDDPAPGTEPHLIEAPIRLGPQDAAPPAP